MIKLADRSHAALSGRADILSVIIFGEALGGNPRNPSYGNGRDFSLAWMGMGMMVTAWGLQDPPQWYAFTSTHPTVVQFGFGDGSVRRLKKGVGTSFFSTDWYYLQYAAGMSDGNVVNWDVIGPG